MEREQAIRLMQDLLRRMVEKKGSDLFITAGFPPAIKVDGEIRPQSDRSLSAEQSAGMVRAIMNDRQTKEFDATKECNFAIAPPGIGRFRVSAFVQQGFTGAVLRTINAKIPTLEELELPPILKEVVLSKRGFVILVGGTGSGKSTSLAAMVGYRNEKTRGHIVTIEDPVEYVHAHKGCVVTHREVGVDCESWHLALKNTLRQAPDVILIGEIRDRETMEYGIQFAETGHLVLATLHANSSNQALDRIINFFPEERREQLLMDLSLEHPRADLAAPDTARSGVRPHRRDGNHAGIAADLGFDLQGRCREDQGRDVALQPARHEDLRPGAVRAVRGGTDLLRGCAAQCGFEERAAVAREAGKQARDEESRKKAGNRCRSSRKRKGRCSKPMSEPAEIQAQVMNTKPLFKLMVEKKASDLFFTCNAPVKIKIEGKIFPVNKQMLSPGDRAPGGARADDRRSRSSTSTRSWRSISRSPKPASADFASTCSISAATRRWCCATSRRTCRSSKISACPKSSKSW